jgi:PIN domain nuclease of toxin-antitoxin system
VNILLDTCTFNWILTDPKKLSAGVRELCTDEENNVHLSVISVWEIALKHSQGKMDLPAPLAKILLKEMVERLITGMAFTLQASLRSINLPFHHKDPFDRMLICQALAHDLVILTPDKNFRKYEGVKVVW